MTYIHRCASILGSFTCNQTGMKTRDEQIQHTLRIPSTKRLLEMVRDAHGHRVGIIWTLMLSGPWSRTTIVTAFIHSHADTIVTLLTIMYVVLTSSSLSQFKFMANPFSQGCFTSISLPLIGFACCLLCLYGSICICNLKQLSALCFWLNCVLTESRGSHAIRCIAMELVKKYSNQYMRTMKLNENTM